MFCNGLNSIKKVIIYKKYDTKEDDKIKTNLINENNSTKEEITNNTDSKESELEKYDWYLEIPKIGLYAPIEEGTDDEILNRSVGHFEDTVRRNGNCGLAGHNRGYDKNYFARVKELENGDIIYYFVDDKKYKYEVKDIFIIYETDWSVLENTEDNMITLITCIENREEYRLCVQGKLIEE